jgi:hypothetical protein
LEQLKVQCSHFYINIKSFLGNNEVPCCDRFPLILAKKAFYEKNMPQARILLGLTGSGLNGEGKAENSLLLAERFETLFVIGPTSSEHDAC